MMGKEEEIARIARRLDKMVTKKSADPGTPAPPRPRAGQDPSPAETPGTQGRPPPVAETPAPGPPCRSLPHSRTPGRGHIRAWTLSREPPALDSAPPPRPQ
ncbi:hypothetical protein P7K49_010137 [Saguinus oedipus]|uniref:Uncharacterized protein n=1 Tax=Saguinus oedipus TaxID=9490 RepID=A0ABQ9VMN8_SAGOE|nr:hypothetical protein P7K49_010137 [Saguinus oedipus]